MIKRILLGAVIAVLLIVLAVLFWPEKTYQAYVPSDEYIAQVDNFHVPPMPTDWAWKSYTTQDGTRLRWGETGNRDAAKASLLIIPGYTATVTMYGEHVDRLARRGYHVMGLDLRGQGGSERHFPKQPEKLWVKDFGVYSDDVAEFIASQKQTDRLIIPVAISFGGHVATRTAVENPDLFDGLFLIAPAIEPKAGADVPFEKAGSQLSLLQKLKQGRRYLPGTGNWVPATPNDLLTHGIEYCSSNPKRLPLRDAIFTNMPEQRVGGVTVQWGAEFFKSAAQMKEVGYFEPLSMPVYIMAAERDDFVSNAAIDKFCDDVQSCQLVRFDGTGHCLPQETDEVVTAMFDEIDKLYMQLMP